MAGGRLELDDLQRVQLPGPPVAWGAGVAYALRRGDAEARRHKSAIWASSLDGSAPRRLTQGEVNDRQPMADPGGAFLCFLSGRERGDQVWRLDAAGGEARRLTSFGYGSLGAGAISPDGATLAILFTPADDPEHPILAADRVDRPTGDDGPDAFPGAAANEPAYKERQGQPTARVYARRHTRLDGAGWEGGFRTQLWLVDTASGAARRLTSGPCVVTAVAWHPDGGSVFVTRLPLPRWDAEYCRNELVRIGVDGGEPQPVPTPDGAVEAPSVSPDGTRVAWVFAPVDLWGWMNWKAGFTDLRTGAVVLLGASLDRSVGDWGLDDLLGSAFTPVPPLWEADALLVLASDHDAVRLLRLGFDQSAAWLSPAERCLAWPVRLADGGIGGVVASAGEFAEVGRMTTSGPEARTNHNDALAADVGLRKPERVEIATPEGTLQGWYLAPRGTAPLPAPGLLYIHGGPHVAYAARVVFEMHWLADQGFGMTWGNPRGSAGSGEAWGKVIDPRWGPAETPDFLALAEHMAARPEIDAARLGVTGGSYGGYMTLYLAEHTSRFRAAVADRGLYDWALSWAGGDFGRFAPATLELPSPPDDLAAWADRSLLRDTQRVTIPFLVMQAMEDHRCDMSQALALFERLQLQGTPSALVLFPEESHGLSRGGRMDRRRERMRQIAGWFRRWL